MNRILGNHSRPISVDCDKPSKKHKSTCVRYVHENGNLYWEHSDGRICDIAPVIIIDDDDSSTTELEPDITQEEKKTSVPVTEQSIPVLEPSLCVQEKSDVCTDFVNEIIKTQMVEEKKCSITQKYAELFRQYFNANSEKYPDKRFKCMDGKHGDYYLFVSKIIKKSGVESSSSIMRKNITRGYDLYVKQLNDPTTHNVAMIPLKIPPILLEEIDQKLREDLATSVMMNETLKKDIAMRDETIKLLNTEFVKDLATIRDQIRAIDKDDETSMMKKRVEELAAKHAMIIDKMN